MSASSVILRTLSTAFGGLLLLMVFVTSPNAAPVPVPRSATEEEDAEPAQDPKAAVTNPFVRFAAARSRMTSENNLKQIGLAFHNYHGVNEALPTDIRSKDGKPLLSWRVQLLPYLEHQALYHEFHHDEPWNSKHNLALLEKMPDVFASARVKLKKKGYTVYQTFSGPDTLFRPGKPGLRFTEVTDGLSNTILAVESSTAVPWTKPADIPFVLDKPVPAFGKAYGKRPLALAADGGVHWLDDKITPALLKALITPDKNEVIGTDW
jgi:Protein of unknown function (DUF1559)